MLLLLLLRQGLTEPRLALNFLAENSMLRIEGWRAWITTPDLCGAEDETQGFVLAKQTSYSLSYIPSLPPSLPLPLLPAVLSWSLDIMHKYMFYH